MAGDMICDRNAGAMVCLGTLSISFGFGRDLSAPKKRCKDEDWQTSTPRRIISKIHHVPPKWIHICWPCVTSVQLETNSSTAQRLTSSKVSRLKASIVLYPWKVCFQIRAGEFPLQPIIPKITIFIFIHIYHYLSTTFWDDLDWCGNIICNQKSEQQLPRCVHLPRANRSGSRPKLVESWWTFYIRIFRWLDSRPCALQNNVPSCITLWFIHVSIYHC